jgi:predicted alpha/beta superfamily hydrolase
MTKHLRATIPATQVHTLKSSNNNQKYRISVSTPYSYTEKPDMLYPVVYVLDANWYFGMVTETARIMTLQGFPDVITVGIGYPIDEPLEENFPEIINCRTRDYTPVFDKKFVENVKEWVNREIEFGGANIFLEFIEEELNPMIESGYRADPSNRTIVGHSLGGLFALYSLFHRPKLFQRYIAGSPSLHIGDRVTHTYEKIYSKKRKTLPARLYLGAGALEYSTNVSLASELFKFIAILEERSALFCASVQQ